MKRVDNYKKKIVNLSKNKKTIFVLSIPQFFKKKVTNSLLLINSGKIIYTVRKKELPNYGVFDEKRYFSSYDEKRNIFKYKNSKIKFLICEDMWADDFFKKKINRL